MWKHFPSGRTRWFDGASRVTSSPCRPSWTQLSPEKLHCPPTAAQAEELASADATTTKTLDDIEALLASLKSSSLLVGAPSAPAVPRMPTAAEMPAAVAAQRSWSLVKSRFMDVHNNAAAAEGSAAGPAAAAEELGGDSSLTGFNNALLQNKPLPPLQQLGVIIGMLLTPKVAII